MNFLYPAIIIITLGLAFLMVREALHTDKPAENGAEKDDSEKKDPAVTSRDNGSK